MSGRRAKIVCTIGPACDEDSLLEQLIAAGMDVARLNFSHGTHEEHRRRIEGIRRAAERCRKPIAILQDLCGPKIRTGRVGGSMTLEQGAEVRLVEGADGGGGGVIPVRYEGLVADVKPGDGVLLDDGRITLRVQAVRDAALVARVEQGGTLRDNGGVHLPAARVRLSAVTDKDKADLSFGLSNGVDYVALSFVRSPDDVRLVRDICEAWGRPTPIVAKIETPQAVDRIDEILDATDAIMVARGDLGVEFPPEHVPVIQKQLIAAARRAQAPVIVATEMLHSMVESNRPTRAESSDVANAVFDGADCLMLSGETANGKHPILACGMMARIIAEAEGSSFYSPQISDAGRGMSVAMSIARNAADIARELEAKLVVAFTESGHTARLVSTARARMPIVAFSPNERTRRKMALFWGVSPHMIEGSRDVDDLMDRANGHVLAKGYASPGDRFVAVFGSPLGVAGSTNTIRVRVVG
ncbi:MAG: pyruvate kinase [Polyangiaceae bacterium]|nr:pyruvate kinase [Polyangiaceae bacterium]